MGHLLKTFGTIDGINWYQVVDEADRNTPIVDDQVWQFLDAQSAYWIARHAQSGGLKLPATEDEIWLSSNNAVALRRTGNICEIYVWGNTSYVQVTDRSADPDNVLARLGKNLTLYEDDDAIVNIGNGAAPSGSGNIIVMADSSAHPTSGTGTSIFYSIDVGGVSTPWAQDDSGNQRPVVPGMDQVTLGTGITTFAADLPMITVAGDAGGNTIATITGKMAYAGSRITLLFVDANVIITDDNTHATDSIDLASAFTSADDTILELIHNGVSWYECSRSVN